MSQKNNKNTFVKSGSNLPSFPYATQRQKVNANTDHLPISVAKRNGWHFSYSGGRFLNVYDGGVGPVEKHEIQRLENKASNAQNYHA